MLSFVFCLLLVYFVLKFTIVLNFCVFLYLTLFIGCCDRSLVDTVYALKDQVKELKSNVVLLSSQLEEEIKARRTLQNIISTHLVGVGKDDIHWPEN